MLEGHKSGVLSVGGGDGPQRDARKLFGVTGCSVSSRRAGSKAGCVVDMYGVAPLKRANLWDVTDVASFVRRTL